MYEDKSQVNLEQGQVKKIRKFYFLFSQSQKKGHPRTEDA